MEKQVEIADQKKVLTWTIQEYTEEQKRSITFTCGLLEASRRVYYHRLNSQRRTQVKANEAIHLVWQVRKQLPRAGTRKLYHNELTSSFS